MEKKRQKETPSDFGILVDLLTIITFTMRTKHNRPMRTEMAVNEGLFAISLIGLPGVYTNLIYPKDISLHKRFKYPNSLDTI